MLNQKKRVFEQNPLQKRLQVRFAPDTIDKYSLRDILENKPTKPRYYNDEEVSKYEIASDATKWDMIKARK